MPHDALLEAVREKKPFQINRQSVRLNPDSSRVITRPFNMSESRIMAVIRRVMSLPEEEVSALSRHLLEDYARRHRYIQRQVINNYDMVKWHIPEPDALSEERKLLIGAYFTMEYAIESAALFNPSIVLDPDQSGLNDGEIRCILSLRATGEGHLSSIEFRSIVVKADGWVAVKPASRFVAQPVVEKDKLYDKHLLRRKALSLGAPDPIPSEEEPGTELSHFVVNGIVDGLGDEFRYEELCEAIANYLSQELPYEAFAHSIVQRLQLVANANYEIRFSEDSDVSERVLFPVSANERQGMEDARFVQFVEDDGTSVWLATYTASDGKNVFSQLLETPNFRDFKVHTVNGQFSETKGMAFFPRRVNGHYAMISRVDGENLYLMYSDNLHFWDEAIYLRGPEQPWEFMQIGNCGSPIETEEGWLLLTHGVGPMRRYCIGAILLDKDDPSCVVKSLPYPLLEPDEEEREGYVPNVVYSCGALIHNGNLILPYAVSDMATRVATVPVDQLLSAME